MFVLHNQSWALKALKLHHFKLLSELHYQLNDRSQVHPNRLTIRLQLFNRVVHFVPNQVQVENLVASKCNFSFFASHSLANDF